MDSLRIIYKQAEIKIVNALFSLFWFYNYLFVVVEEKLNHYGFLKNYFVTKNQLVEPNLETWNCVASFTPQFKLIEQYKYGSEEEPVLKEGALFIRKCDTYRLSFITNKERVDPTPCATRFLNIMYFNKGMQDPIKVHLDPAYIRNGNEVLSKTFVYRMLCYQYNPGDYVFDDSYEVHLMDDKIRKRVLNSNDYVVFGNGGYEVVNEVLSLVLPENTDLSETEVSETEVSETEVSENEVSETEVSENEVSENEEEEVRENVSEEDDFE